MGKYLYHPITLFIATLLTLTFYFSTNSSIKKYQKSAEAINSIENNSILLEQEIATLEKQKAFAESDFAKEKIIRDELLLQKPGEYILQLPDTLPSPPSPSPSPSPKPIEQWKNLLLQ